MLLLMTNRHAALLGISSLLGGFLLIVFALFLAIKYDILGKMFPNAK